MTFLRSLVLSAVVLASSQAFAGTVMLDEYGNTSSGLPSCGGYVSLTKGYSGQLSLSIYSARECSNLEIGGVPYKMGGYQGSYSATVPLRKEYGILRASVSSNTGAHRDTIIITLRDNNPGGGSGGGYGSDVTLSTNGRRFARLPSCGGTVELNTGGGYARQINLVFSGVRSCSNFDILSNDGRYINYPNKKLGGVNGSRSGSFTLPQSVIDFGHNGVRVVVRSNTGAHDDIIYVRFYAF